MTGERVRELAHSLGAQVCGIAAIGRFGDAPKGFHPADILPEARSAVLFGRQFPKSVFRAATNAPYTMVRCQLNSMTDDIAVGLAAALEEEGFLAVPIPSSEPYEYWDPQLRHGRGILSLKHAAKLAGLGYIGKNTLLINGTYGNRLWLGGILTDAPLESDAMDGGGCPKGCRLCLDSCPQSALDGVTIEQIRCREISGTSTEGGGFLYACNICRKVCPHARV